MVVNKRKEVTRLGNLSRGIQAHHKERKRFLDVRGHTNGHLDLMEAPLENAVTALGMGNTVISGHKGRGSLRVHDHVTVQLHGGGPDTVADHAGLTGHRRRGKSRLRHVYAVGGRLGEADGRSRHQGRYAVQRPTVGCQQGDGQAVPLALAASEKPTNVIGINIIA